MKFPKIDKNSNFYRNCRNNRNNDAKICTTCPFRKGIESQERREKCTACGGSGYYDHNGSPKCASCNGTGLGHS